MPKNAVPDWLVTAAGDLRHWDNEIQAFIRKVAWGDDITLQHQVAFNEVKAARAELIARIATYLSERRRLHERRNGYDGGNGNGRGEDAS